MEEIISSIKTVSPPLSFPVPEISIIIPTFNEVKNITHVIDTLRKLLIPYQWEIIVVDDNSPDGTSQLVQSMVMKDARIRCIKRVHRRGLAGACLEGALASQAPYIIFMDGDLQHDETTLIPMLNLIKSPKIDLVIASRYLHASFSSNLSPWRAYLSQFSTNLAHRLLRVKVSDPLSGFFLIKRSVIERLAPALKTQGFKLLLDILTTSNGELNVGEIPYHFRERKYGRSKLDFRVMFDFVSLFIEKLSAGMISGRFLLYSSVGILGVGFHVLLLKLFLNVGLRFELAQSLTTLLVIALNFLLNNFITYCDQRLVGKNLLFGLMRFELICSVGFISNLSIANWIFAYTHIWWLAGISGALMAAIWNYLISASLIWGKRVG